MFFRYYPAIPFVDEKGVAILIRNIMVRANISDTVKTKNALFTEYNVVDGETPEGIAKKVYGDVKYYWVIMLMNDIRHIHCDWLKRYDVVVAEAELKYGKANLDEPNYYVDTLGNIVCPDETDDATPVSNLQYELDENEKKRRIKVLNSLYIDLAEKELKSLLKE